MAYQHKAKGSSHKIITKLRLFF